MKFLASVALLLITFSSAGQQILFVGNSLTYTNNLPNTVKILARQIDKKIKVECLCFPNYALEDHWNDGKLQQMLADNAYDYVVFQQGPSSQAYGRTSLIEQGAKIAQLAEQHGGKAAYFMVWPSLTYYHTFPGVIENHRYAAEVNKTLLIPLGRHWQKYREQEGMRELYSVDGFHPSQVGSLFAALTIIKSLFPETDLETLKYKPFRHVLDRTSFDTMLKLISEEGQ